MVELAATLGRLLTRDGNRIGAVLYDNDDRARHRTARRPHAGARGSPATCCRARRAAGTATDLGGLFRAGLNDHPAPVARVRALRLHQRAGVGARARRAGAAPRGRRASGSGTAARSDWSTPGCVVMQDAETGEQLVVDTSDPAVPPPLRRGRRGTRRGAAHRDPAGRRRPATTCRPTTTSSACCSAWSPSASGGPAMTFLGARGAARAAARPGARRRVRVARAAAAPSTQATLGTMARATARASRSAGAPRRARWCCWSASIVLLVGLARPQATIDLPAPAGDGRPRLRRVVEHEGEGPRADAHRRGEEGGADVRGRPAVDDPHRRGRVQRHRLRRAAADALEARRARRDRPALAGAAAPRSAGGSSRRSARSPGSRSRSTARRSRRGRANPGSASSGRPRSCCSPTVTTPRSSIPLALAPVAAQAGVRIFPIGLGSPSGAVVEIDGFSVATALDADLLRSVARTSGGTYFAAEDAATLQQIYQRIDLKLTTVGRKTEITAVFAGVALVLLLIAAGTVDALVRAGDLTCASSGRWRCSALLIPLAAIVALPCGSDAGGGSTRSPSPASSLVKQAMPERSRWRRLVPAGLLLAAIVALVVAMARPQALVTTSRSDTSIMLTLDVSRSMCSTDVQPNRLAAAQAAARKFVDDQPTGTRLGIVVFAGSAQIVVPPTDDRDRLHDAIDGFTTSIGTAIGNGILASIDALARGELADRAEHGEPRRDEQRRDRFASKYVPDVVVLLTDGAATTGVDPRVAARQAADRGVRVFTIGFGTDQPDDAGVHRRAVRWRHPRPVGGGGRRSSPAPAPTSDPTGCRQLPRDRRADARAPSPRRPAAPTPGPPTRRSSTTRLRRPAPARGARARGATSSPCTSSRSARCWRSARSPRRGGGTASPERAAGLWRRRVRDLIDVELSRPVGTRRPTSAGGASWGSPRRSRRSRSGC